MKTSRIIITLLKILIPAIFILFFFNGLTFYKIPQAELEKTFLDKVEKSDLQSGEINLKESYGNSLTLLFRNNAGETACGTYVKSIYGNKWKEMKFYTSKMGIFKNNQITYEITDLYTGYPITCTMGSTPKVEFGDTTVAILSVKFFGICVILMAGFAGRLWGLRIFKKK